MQIEPTDEEAYLELQKLINSAGRSKRVPMIVTAENFNIITEILLESAQKNVESAGWCVANEMGSKIQEYRDLDDAEEEYAEIKKAA